MPQFNRSGVWRGLAPFLLLVCGLLLGACAGSDSGIGSGGGGDDDGGDDVLDNHGNTGEDEGGGDGGDLDLDGDDSGSGDDAGDAGNVGSGGGSHDGGDWNPGGGSDDGPSFEDFAVQYGMNASFANWTSREILFADAMMRGMEFGVVQNGNLSYEVPPLIPTGQDPPLLGAGWPDFRAMAPSESAGSRLMNVMEGSMPDGRYVPYVLEWRGTGSCRLVGQAVTRERRRTSNRVEVYIDPSAAGGNSQLAMYIESSTHWDPVRDVHVWLPGMEAEKPLFWPPYLEKVQALNHGLGPYSWRTLDWTRVNDYGRSTGNHLFTFDLAGLIRPENPSQGTRRGMCPEFQVAFCNAVGANLHFQVPHRTGDMSVGDYVAFLMDTLTRIRDGSPAVLGINGDRPFAGLAPGLVVTLELSNEIWNGGFPVYYWMQREATRKGIDVPTQIASQLELVFGVADHVFSGEHAARLEKYVGGSLADPTFAYDVMEALPPGFEVSSLGPAGYFGPRPSVIQEWLLGSNPDTGYCPNCPTVLEVIEASRDRIPDLRALFEVHRNIADLHVNPDGSHPGLVLYEGGQGIVAGYQPWVDEANAAQVHPLMYDAYVQDLVPVLVEEEVDVILWYSFMTDQNPVGGNGAGPFGIWNDMTQRITLPVPDLYLDEGAPKAAAVYRGPPLLE